MLYLWFHVPCRGLTHEVNSALYLYSGERLNVPDEVLLQQLVIQLIQMRVDNGVVPQLCFVFCQSLCVCVREKCRDEKGITKDPIWILQRNILPHPIGRPAGSPFQSQLMICSCWLVLHFSLHLSVRKRESKQWGQAKWEQMDSTQD